MAAAHACEERRIVAWGILRGERRAERCRRGGARCGEERIAGESTVPTVRPFKKSRRVIGRSIPSARSRELPSFSMIHEFLGGAANYRGPWVLASALKLYIITVTGYIYRLFP